MIEEIRISSLGVIEASTLQLGPGLTVITGETGAGKTMVVTALGLLLGGRADAGSVRAGAAQARVEGVVAADSVPGLTGAVEAAGGTVEDQRVLLARNVAAGGRSRAFVGGAAVPVATLTALADPLVTVHGQSDQHRLRQPRAQREALDRFGGPDLAGLAEEHARGWASLASAQHELEAMVSTVRERAREADLLRFGIGEVEAIAPEPGEAESLAAEEARLGHADTLRAAAEEAREALSSEADASDALGSSAAARRALEAVREHDPVAAELADRLASLTYLLSDVAADVASYASRVEVDPARLAAVSERRARLTALTRKYGENLEAVLAWAESARRRLLDLDSTEDRIAELRTACEEQRASLGVLAGALSAARCEVAVRLAESVTAELALLAMPQARLEVVVSQGEIGAEDPAALLVGGRSLRAGAHGVDEIELLLAANAGSGPRPLAKSASGGELSRVMLGVEVAFSGTSPVPTFVFDEVDAGVGGAAAVEVGRRLAALARTAQVLVVTHLPQVAAYADRHVVVEKSDDGTITSSGLTMLDDAGRERELSRMLAGLAGSETGLAHARELLDRAQRTRARSV